MPSPEQPRGPEPHEREPTPYYKAARFSGERPAGQVYDQLQETIYTAPQCDLSVYRLQLDRIYHVAILGETPAEDLDRRITRLLARGESTTLPSEVLTALAARRRQATRLAPWVERHTRPNPPQESP
jgi:hypothetical protein